MIIKKKLANTFYKLDQYDNVSYPRSRYQTSSDHPLKKFGKFIFPLAVLGTIFAFAYGGFVGNFIGYLALGCVIFVGLYYMTRLFL